MCPSADHANLSLSALTSFTNLLTFVQTPPTVLPHLCGATLLASPSRKEGTVLLLWGRSFDALPQSASLSCLAPTLQLGVGVKGGCKAIVHSVSSLLSSSTPNRCWTVLLHFTNPFNSISREAMFTKIRQ